MSKNLKYEAARELIKSQRFVDGCACNSCVEKREQGIFKDAVAMFYPELPFVPDGVAYFIGLRPLDQLHWLNEQRLINNRYTANWKEADPDRELFWCKFCGGLVLEEDSTEHGDDRYCRSCMRKVFFCDDCGDIHSSGDCHIIHSDTGNKKLCHACSNTYDICGDCRMGYAKGSLVYFDIGARGDGLPTKYGVCSACSEKNKRVCSSCGTISHKKIVGLVGNNMCLCQACKEEEKGLHQYYYKPIRLHFQSAPKEGRVSENAFHMGFELEVARYKSFVDIEPMCYLIKERYGKEYVYCIHDGTIERGCGYPGMEVVTHPFTWQEYKTNGIDRWTDLCLYLRSKGWKANMKGIGFHVHTTKAAWGTHQIYKLMKLIYGNKSFVTKIAQRKANEYCTMSSADFDEAVLVAKDKKNRQADHYGAINLNKGNGSSSTTIEFRMFQGTLEPLYLHKNIEFVKACYDFTRTHVTMKKKDFQAFIKNNRRLYPSLNEFITMKGVK